MYRNNLFGKGLVETFENEEDKIRVHDLAIALGEYSPDALAIPFYRENRVDLHFSGERRLTICLNRRVAVLEEPSGNRPKELDKLLESVQSYLSLVFPYMPCVIDSFENFMRKKSDSKYIN